MPTEIAVSIVLVCKNPGTVLQTALESVWSQTTDGYELIVVDGGSTDGTREWLQTRQAKIAALISEPDRGIYDAMNKGVTRASGLWVLFLGADDRLASSTVLSEVLADLRAEDEFAVGNVSYTDGRRWNPMESANPRYRNFVHHQGCFYARRQLALHPFDPTLRIQGDYDLNLRLLIAGVTRRLITHSVSVCGNDGLSDSGPWMNYCEEIRVRHRYFPFLVCLCWDCGSVLRYFRKRIFRKKPNVRPEYRPRPQPRE